MKSPIIVTEDDGNRVWYLDGKIHREDGPAYIHPNGTKQWFIRNKNVTKIVNQFMKEHNVTCIEEMDDEVQCLFWIMLGSV